MTPSEPPHSGWPGRFLGSLPPSSTPTNTPSPPVDSQSVLAPTDRAGYVVSLPGGCQPSVAAARSQPSGTVTVRVLRESDIVVVRSAPCHAASPPAPPASRKSPT